MMGLNTFIEAISDHAEWTTATSARYRRWLKRGA
jgi:hypothetical protein